MARTNPLELFETILIVAIGGFAGANLRYYVDLTLTHSLIATLTVNVLGCLALGFILYEEIYGNAFSAPGRTILATGFIASFTTYSTFILDALTTAPLTAITYIAGTYLLGFVAVLLGRGAARIATNRHESQLEDPT